MAHKIHTRKRRYLTIKGPERNRSPRPKTFKSEAEAKKLRKQGYTFRAIGKELGIDFGYARKLILKG